MKLTVKVKTFNNINLPKVTGKGDWVDLRAAESCYFSAPQAGILKKHKVNGVVESHRDVHFTYGLIPLGIAMKLPKGFEAIVVPRSSTLKRFGIIQSNSIGIIDNSYCGNNDKWCFPAIALRDIEIEEGNRICQFRIQLSQKATMWQKLKWLFSSGIKFVETDSLDETDRGGFGSTGTK